MVLNVHGSLGTGRKGEGGMEVGEEGEYIPIATLSPPEWLLHSDGQWWEPWSLWLPAWRLTASPNRFTPPAPIHKHTPHPTTTKDDFMSLLYPSAGDHTEQRAQELCERRDNSPGHPAFFFYASGSCISFYSCGWSWFLKICIYKILHGWIRVY